MEITLLGFAAGVLTSFGFIPQVIKAIVTRRTADIALFQPLLLSAGITLWLIYGILRADPAIIIANGFALVCNLLLLLLKLVFR